MTMIVWDSEQEDSVLYNHNHHTEFVVGLDFNLFVEGQVILLLSISFSL